MAPHPPVLQRLVDQVRTARDSRTALDIRGGDSKRFYGETPRGEPLDVRPLAGISSYEPSELVVTVRAGTPLAELEAGLAEKGQCLPFEPPRFGADGAKGTVGGMVAAGLSGPARASVGVVRDYVLGTTVLNGHGEVLSFGGQVIKNVAGYDVSRVMAGSMGVLGVICEVSLKVLPMAAATCTLGFDIDAAGALQKTNGWNGQPLPISATAWRVGTLVVRLAGAAAAVQAARVRLGGERMDAPAADAFWAGLRDHSGDFFADAQQQVAQGASLWRISVPQTAAPLVLPGEQLMEWGGGQRWLCTRSAAAPVREAAAAAGGHATLFRGGDKRAGVFTPLKPPLDRIHRALKRAFDPDALFNPGRLYPDL